MATSPARPTLDEFLRLPEEEPMEFFAGAITSKVSPKLRHSRLQIVLARLLEESTQHGTLAWVLPELRTTFAEASVVPDIAVLRRERVPVDAEGQATDDVLEPPDIAIEIVSPEHYRGLERSSGDPLSITPLVRRCLWYVSHGVQIALHVDPDDGSVLAFRPDQPAVAWHGSEPIDLHEVLPDFNLTVDQLFASLQRD